MRLRSKILRVDPADRKIGLSRRRLDGDDDQEDPGEPTFSKPSAPSKPRELRGGTGGATGTRINMPESGPKAEGK